jgi:ADP-heptose:LPS heptosyltransferase
LSASISCSEALAAIRRGEHLPAPVIRTLGEEQPTEFFRVIIESLADSFDPEQAAAYEELMRVWIPPQPPMRPVVPERVETVYVLSRVTLGADIKITSTILDAMKTRFPEGRIVLVSNPKSAELFAADSRISYLDAVYPRSGPVSRRIKFAHELRREMEGPRRIVVDPDSRITQLGLIPVCEPLSYFHFPSRTADSAGNLTELTQRWLEDVFGESGHAYIAPEAVRVEGNAPRAAVSFGVGENESKRIGGDFESEVLRALGERFETIWIDRGVGGEEARRVTAAAEASGCSACIRFSEGSFAEFASVIAQSDLYVGYDSAGQHAAAAANVPLISLFAGAPSERFRQRWSPAGSGRIHVIAADSLSPVACLKRFLGILSESMPFT